MTERTGKDLIYVIIFFPDLRRAVCLDRAYNYLPMHTDRELWKGIKMGDIVETDRQSFYPQCPGWAHTLHYKGHKHIACWTNYYE